MAAMSSQSLSLEALVESAAKALPGVSMKPGDTFFWSPKESIITYRVGQEENIHDQWAFLHELSHALLGHSSYASDFELLLLEVAAWQKAKEIAPSYNLAIDEEHIQDCLDTYRDWLHQRASCPGCSTVSLQVNPTLYTCHNCHTSWTVSSSRFCRPYRLNSIRTKTPPATTQVTFR